MPNEALHWLQVEQGGWYVDCTLGGGGHTQMLLNNGAHVVAFDWDESAINHAKENFQHELQNGHLVLIRESFAQLGVIRKDPLLKEVDIKGILFDFGTSTDQLMSAERGFSFNGNAPLDMRMDNRRGVTAADLIKFLAEKELVDVLESAGEHDARKIAPALKKVLPTTTRELADTVTRAKGGRHTRLNPATKTFMALRIAVNTEMTEITAGLPEAFAILAPGGRIVTISFHDGEDRIVKRAFEEWERAVEGKTLTPKPVEPSETEVFHNPRSRSAKLRVFAKRNK